MVYIDLIINLSLLVALSVVSGFIDKRWSRSTRFGVLMQGVLFGAAAVIGMLRPLNLGPGLIFDGRSVMVSLCALFFGPWAASVAVLITIPCRIALGGSGMIMGVLVILSSAVIGLAAHFRQLKATEPPSTRNLYLFGLVVHLVMVALMLTLPGNLTIITMKRVGIPVILLYPIATILVGKILSDQLSAIRYVENLKRSEEKFSKTFNTNPIPVAISTLEEGRFLDVNDALLDTFSFSSKAELIGKTSLELGFFADPHDRQRIRKAIEETGRVHNFDLNMVAKDGRVLACLFSAEPIAINNKNCLLTAAIDISMRKRAEEALRESEDLYRTLFESSADGILIADIENRQFLYANPAICNMFGYTEEQFKKISVAEIHPHDDLLRVIAEFNAQARGEKILASDIPCLRKDKTVFYADINTVKILIEGKYCNMGLFRDTIGRRELENQRKVALEEINKLNENLEQKVEERTAELQKTIALLEETNRAFVGRELRMIELKERIAELERKDYSDEKK